MLRRSCFAKTIKYKIARGQILIRKIVISEKEIRKGKSVVVTAYPTQDWGTRSDVKVGDHKAATLKLHKAI